MDDTWWVKPDQLDDDQKKLISVPLDKNHLILGPPGSGKTNLLLLRANYISKSGFPDIVILVFTRTLKEFIMTGASQYSFSSDKIQTSHQWMLSFLRQYGVALENTGGFQEKRTIIINSVNETIEKHNVQKMHEVILLDESQDYLPEEIEIFYKLSKQIYAVADIRQKIYDGQSPIDYLKEICDTTFELKMHYRNGLRICQLADGLIKNQIGYDLLSGSSNYDEERNPSAVNIFHCDDIETQCKKIEERLKTQLKAYPKEFIGVLCPLRKDVRTIGEFLSKGDLAALINMQLNDERNFPLDIDKPIIVCTIHSAKGLEFRTLHLASFEYIKKFRMQRLLSYMATTRVKTSLSVYYTNNLPGYFEQADLNMKRPPKLPDLNDVFGIEE
jgi:superfamily I DNA/RNA helicase